MPLRLHILVKVRLDEAKPLLNAALDVPTSFLNISKDLLAAEVSENDKGN